MNRRDLLSSAPVLAGAILIGETLDAQPQNRHREWFNEWRVVRTDMNEDPEDLHSDDPRWDVVMRLEEAICTTPAENIHETLVQLEFALHEDAGFEIENNIGDNLDGQLFASVLNAVREVAS